MNKYYHNLELNKIVDLVRQNVFLDRNKKYLEHIELMNNIDEIRKSLKETDEASIILQREGRSPLYFSSDVSFYLSKVSKNGVLTENELLNIMLLLDTVKETITFSSSLDESIECPLFKENVSNLVYPKELNLKIKTIITNYAEIKDDASSNLKDIRRKRKEIVKQIQSKLIEIMNKNASLLSQSIISTRNERYVLSVKNDYKNSIKGIIHDTSSSGETVFIEPSQVVELSNKGQKLEEEEKREIYTILKNISIEINNYYDELINSYDIISHFDLIFGKAKYCLSYDGAMPSVNNEGILELYNCFHPLLNTEKIVKNNVILGKTYQGIIITGPNTGGKTVLLKTLGLLSLMVKFGLLLPASSSSNVMIFDNVFSDIGDDQSISQNLSTFSSHLKNQIDIINNVTKNSLVLLDEVGSGTDPSEGSALAISIFDELIEKNCLVVATSHYSELKLHAYNSKNVINASVEFDIDTLKPTYRLLLGIPGESNALKICKILGLNKSVIERAEKYVYEKNNDINVILEKITADSKELEKKLNQIDEKLKSAKLNYDESIKFKEETEIQRKRILEKAEKDAKSKASNLLKESNLILDELSKMKTKEVKLHEISDIKHRLRELNSESEVENEVNNNNINLKTGDSVYIEKYNSYGKIIKELKNYKYEVALGNTSIKLEKSLLKKVNTSSNVIEKPKENVNVRMPKKVSLSLDLRGERYEDALLKLEKYLDDCYLAGFEVVSIIHGYGTGVIREMVQNYLKKSDLVKEYRYGMQGEGLKGATIVTFKK